jgi:hypothetical protein
MLLRNKFSGFLADGTRTPFMGGGGGGGGQPTQSTSYTTNLPEYAKPYVMNMLGAAQNQLFTTTPGTDGQPGEITGFKPYTPYSTDPTNYFAGPSSLQRQVYGEAGQMQTPGQFGAASGLAGMSGMGQLGTTGQAGMYGQQGSMFGGLGTALGAAGAMQAMPAFGAGQQFAQQVTDPRSMAQYMSPYQQAVTDVAKNAAVREAQIAGQQANLGAARQGTYGGARQALASAERERGLLSNLSNIQAQGSQAAFDKAMQAQQFGANLGLQGIQTGLQGVQQGLAGTAQGMQGAGLGLQGVSGQQAGFAGAGQAASTLGQLGGAQQQADLARMGFQQQTGQQQQAYQQNIINQAIQDFATQQQYPYMQLSTMSNLLRGLPMQSMSTQQYQAQPSTTQQLLGLAGTGASLYGAMGRKEGGAIKEYAAGGTIRGLENKIDDIGDAGGAKGLQALLAQTKSPRAKELIMERMREEGIAAAPTGKLGTNMAGGGIIAFEEGGDVKRFYNEGAVKDEEMSELDKIRANNEAIKSAAGKFFDLSNYDPLQQGYRAYKQFVYDPITKAVNKSPEEQAVEFRKASDARDAKRGMFSSSKEEKKKDDRDIAAAKVEADVRKKTEAAKTKQQAGFKFDPDAIDREDAGIGAALRANQPKPKPDTPPPAVPPTAANQDETGIDAALAARRKRLGIDGPGEKNEALMRALEERQAGLGKQNEADRYLRMAEAFAKFGSTAGPIGRTAAEALGGFAKGEAGARKEQDKVQMEGMKIQADLEKARRAEARGDLEAAERLYTSAEDRKNRLQVASRPGEFEKMYAKFAEGEVAAGRKPSFESFRKAYSGADEDLVRLTKADTAVKMLKEDTTPGGYMQLAASKKPEDRQKAAQMLAAVYQRYGVDPTTGAVIGSQAAAPGKVIDFNAIK